MRYDFVHIYYLLLLLVTSAGEHEIEAFGTSEILVAVPLPDPHRVVTSVVLVSATVWTTSSVAFQCRRSSLGFLFAKEKSTSKGFCGRRVEDKAGKGAACRDVVLCWQMGAFGELKSLLLYVQKEGTVELKHHVCTAMHLTEQLLPSWVLLSRYPVTQG